MVPSGLIDWISGTYSQGCTNLQMLVRCLDHRGTASDYTVHSMQSSKLVLGCAIHDKFASSYCIEDKL